MFSALGCGVHVRQSLRGCSAIWELRIYTTNCSTTLEAVVIFQVIHRVYLRVSNSRFVHQIFAGSERAIMAPWVNDHLSPVHVPHASEVPQQHHCSPLSHVSTLEVLPSPMFGSHSRLAALPSPSNHCPTLGRDCTGGFMGRQLQLPTMACSSAARLGPRTHIPVPSMQVHKRVRLWASIFENIFSTWS